MASVDEKIQKTIDDFTLMDNLFFHHFFAACPKGLEKVISICLDDDKVKLKSMTIEKEITNIEAHSIRMDARAILMDRKHVDLEVQNGSFKEMKRRAKFYLGALVFNSLPKNEDYTNMPDSYFICILDKDYWKGGYEKYETLDNVAYKQSFPEVDENQCHIIYINGQADSETAIGYLMRDFRCTSYEDMYYNVLKERMRDIKSPEGRKEMYSKIREIFSEEIKQGVEQGIEQGIVQGREQYRDETIQKMKRKGLTNEQISNFTDIPLNIVQAI